MASRGKGRANVKVTPLVASIVLALVCLAPLALRAQTPTATIVEEVREHTSNLPFAMPALRVPTFPDKRVSIETFGAIPDGHTLNTKAFADAIESCANNGGGIVVVPPGLWLTGPIKLESNVNLYVERGALIEFSKHIEDFPLIAGLDGKSKRFVITPPIYAYRARNVGISGEGVIDGGGEAWRYVKREKMTGSQWKELVASGGVVSSNGREWWPSKEAMDGESYLKQVESSGRAVTKADFAHVKEFIRPDLVQLVQCDGILLDGTTFENSPKFHIRPAQSENIIIRNIKIKAPWYGQNTDGLDPSSCRTMLIYGISIDVGDDGICLKPASIASSQTKGPSCENIIVSDCLVFQAHGGFVIGSESFGGVNNVYVHNCTFIGTDVGLRFKSLRGKGGIVENVFVDGIRMRSIQSDAILFDMYYGGGSPDVEAEKSDDVHTAEPITDRTPQFQKFSIKNIVCDGANAAFVVKGLAEMPVKELTLENITIQSERGVFLTQAEGITFRNVNILSKQGPVIALDEARNIEIDSLSYPRGLSLFMKVVGQNSHSIQLRSVDTSFAFKGLELGPQVPRSAVVVK